MYELSRLSEAVIRAGFHRRKLRPRQLPQERRRFKHDFAERVKGQPSPVMVAGLPQSSLRTFRIDSRKMVLIFPMLAHRDIGFRKWYIPSRI